MELTARDYQLLDDVLARLIDAKIDGAPVTEEHLLLIIKLQRHDHVIDQRWEEEIDVAFCCECHKEWGI